MPTFIIDWFICNGNDYSLNADWYMTLVWSIDENRPKSIIFKRKYSGDSILVTSNLELVGGCTAQGIKAFHGWMPTGCADAQVQLEYSISVYRKLQEHALRSCRIRGEITFSENEQIYNFPHCRVRSEMKSTVKFNHEKCTGNISPIMELTAAFERL